MGKGIVLLDETGRVKAWSQGAEALTGLPAQQVLGGVWEGLLPLASLEVVADLLTPGGRCLILSRPGAAEAALRESEERFQFALRGANDGLWDWNLRTDDVVFSPRWKSMLGYAPHELPDRVSTWRELLHPEDRPGAEERVRQYLAGEIEKYEIEFRLRHKEGSYRNILSRGFLVNGADGLPLRLVGTHVDISERIQAELALRRSEEMLQRTQAIAHVVGWSYDIASDLFTSTGEGHEMIGQCLRRPELLHPEDVQRVAEAWQAARLGSDYEVEFRLLGRGEPRWIYARATTDRDEQGRPGMIIGVAQDITARRRYEEQRQQAQRMEAIGQLAGGVAHDFNNLLTVINGVAEMVIERLPEGWAREEICNILTAGERAASLTQQLLAFSRKQVLQPRVLSLNEVISSLHSLFDRLIGEDIVVTTVLDPSLRPIHADRGQLEQVLLNLAVNARDAMPTGGKITIESRNAEESVELLFTDTGQGIAPQVLDRIFDPFFTTKSNGKGTGLGLATVYGIIKQSGGNISVKSELGRGSCFTMSFPVAEEPRSGGQAEGPRRRLEGNETVLLVEDDDGVRRIARLVLERNGYKVLEANCGAAALELTSRHVGPIDLLVTDIVMPGMNGRQVADALLARYPGLRVLFSSGYIEDEIVRNGVLEGEHFLPKPFTPTKLAETVRGILDR